MKKLLLQVTSMLTLLSFALWITVSSHVVRGATTATATYAADGSVFPNPERGFYSRRDILTERSFGSLFNTIIHSYVRVDAHKNGGPIADALLTNMKAGLAAARSGGKKVILRFAYNFGDYDANHQYKCTNADASEATILAHIDQVTPHLEPYKDVIMGLEAGFIGCWGEWHSSWYQGDEEMPPKINISRKLADALNWPDFQRQAVIRYPSLLRAVLGSGQLTARQQSQLGHHNDCFLASTPDDWGTWNRGPNPISPEAEKAYIAELGISRLIGGETCNSGAGHRVSCTTARSEMRQMHFTYLNEDYEPGAIAIFKSQGCFEEFQRDLGYRLRLLSATYTNSTTPGSSFSLQATLTNDGYASVVNQRPVFAVLDGSGGTFSFPLALDPRTWESGQQVTINQSFTLPATMPAGSYRLALWLPDQATGLRANPAYSIRFANQNVWDATRGFNVLASGIQIGGTAPTATSGTVRTATATSSPVAGGAYEAEASGNTLAGGAAVASCATCSGGAKVGYVGNNSGSLQFNGVQAASAGSRTLTIYYLSGEARTAQLSVNGGAASTISFPSSGGWTTVGSVQVPVTLNAGANTLRFFNSSGWAPDFDRIALSGGSTPTATRTATRTATTGGVATPTRTATRTPTASGARLVLDNFDGAPAWPSSNDLGLWTGANGFVNGSGALSNGELALQFNNGGWFGSDVNRDLSGYATLVLRVRGASGGEQSRVHLVLGGVDRTLGELSGDTITTSVKELRINMATAGINRSAPGQLQLTFWWGGASTLFIDEIRFE